MDSVWTCRFITVNCRITHVKHVIPNLTPFNHKLIDTEIDTSLLRFYGCTTVALKMAADWDSGVWSNHFKSNKVIAQTCYEALAMWHSPTTVSPTVISINWSLAVSGHAHLWLSLDLNSFGMVSDVEWLPKKCKGLNLSIRILNSDFVGWRVFLMCILENIVTLT